MIHLSFQKYGTKKSNVVLLSSFFACLLIAGCTEETQDVKTEEPVSTADVNIHTVEAVLALELTAPDKEYRRLRENVGPVYEHLLEAERQKMEAQYKKIESHVRGKYEPYFTNDGLEGFISMNFVYQFQFQRADYQLSIEEMEVKQSDNKNTSNQYSFTAQVALESPSIEKELYEVTGKAIFSEEGKIGKIQIADKDQLLRHRLNELSNLD